ncbi:MAG: tonB-system energizer ExbB [Candidatus Devosia phytovorans]|uniref:Biopolymer transport protein ExbB n=1 Tax=Candidatus Devosia phytovorans TaxID=3121372 RepID=A0AAJ5VWF4_9HYPH|nr:tonB-system energizer ExbB [Devosia sp.]WEK06029.1 MAG: tonB-system energizer ExbB [Devosia sp.]
MRHCRQIIALTFALGLVFPAVAQVQPPAPAAPVTSEAPEATTSAPKTEPAAIVPVPAATPVTTLPHNLSPWGMFLAADYVVKAVMIGLALASLTTWIVWCAKTLELMGAKRRARLVLRAITSARTLAEATAALEHRRGVGVLLVKAAGEEVLLSLAALDHAGGTGLKERVASRLSRISAAAGRRISRGTGILASVGSVSPFIGLFGTVWGIMNAFIGISEAQTTNLAIVAPGIAEALLATAIGLVAAIPAVIIYNGFSRSIAGYRQLLADAAQGVERLVSRDIDFRSVPAEQA